VYGPASLAASPVATVSTYRDTLTVSMGCDASESATSVTDEVLRLLDDEISRCLGDAPAD
jgi:hypothetical protein